jgi:branched-chain amino acid transport system substrate-binding protein
MVPSKVKAFSSLVTLFALLLAACAPAATPTPAPTRPPAATQAPTPAASPAAKFECKDPLGCVDIAPGQPIHIAYMLVVSGENASLGIDEKRGVEIAIDDRGGKLLDHPIQLTGEDTGCSAEGGQTAAQKVAADKTIVGIVGTTCSSEARAAAPILDKAGLVMISPSNTAPDLTDPAKHLPVYLRTAHNDKVQGRVAAEFAFNQLKVKTAATIHDGSIYADQLQQIFAQEFKKLGGTVTAQEAVQKGDTDMRPVLTKIAAGKPEIIYYPIFMPEGGYITQQARQVSGLENTKLMSADGLFSTDFLKVGKDVVGVYLSSPDFTAFPAAYKDFVGKYQKKYGEKPISVYHAHAYDAAAMLFAAIEKVAVKDPDGTLHIPRKALRDALYATKDFKGLTGNLTCDQYGDCADPHIGVYQITQENVTKGELPSTPIWRPGM